MTAGAAVALTMVLNTILGPPHGRHEINPSAWSRAYGPPQVAGILSSIAFSPNGKVLAVGASGGSQSGSQDKGTTYLLNVSSGKRIETLSPGGGAEAFSPDGAMLATAGGPHNSITYLRSMDSGDTIANLNDHHGSSVESVSFSPNGKCWPSTTGTASSTCGGFPAARGPRPCQAARARVSPPGGPNPNAVAFSPRGTMLAMGGSDGQVYLFDTATDRAPAPCPPQIIPVSRRWRSAHGGALLAASEMDGLTYVWNLDSGSRISLDDPDGAVIESVAFSPDSKWLAAGDLHRQHLPVEPGREKEPEQAGQDPGQPDQERSRLPRPGTRSIPWRSARTAARRHHRHERPHLPVAGALTVADTAAGLRSCLSPACRLPVRQISECGNDRMNEAGLNRCAARHVLGMS